MTNTATISPEQLRELIITFTWLDPEHQQRAVKALQAILDDQAAEKHHRGL